MEKVVCPKCKGEGTVREIIWGMPDGPVDESKYVLGGCCISTDGIDPTHECIKCGFAFTHKRLP
jgi:Zn ribbon nucleic-acid-binding protein